MTVDFKQILDSNGERLKGKKRIALLKELEKISNEIFSDSTEFAAERELLGKDEQSKKKLVNIILTGDYSGIEEYSELFYKIYAVASKRQEIVRELISTALDTIDHGFCEFDKELIKGSANISTAYDKYYIPWLKAVRNSPAAKKIIEMQKTSLDKLDRTIKENGFDNLYTIIDLDEGGEFKMTPCAVFFSKEMKAVLLGFDDLTHKLSKLVSDDEQKKLLEYLKYYRMCLAEEKVENLDRMWERLDEMWMDVKYPIQIVHDIEYGYADPLRTKAIPDFSIRLNDEGYPEANKNLGLVKNTLVNYFKGRKSKLSEKGLFALNNSMAMICYLPFQSGISLHFRFSGQSIPNRPSVKDKKGVKVFLDPVSMGLRIDQTRELMRQVFTDQSLAQKLSVEDLLVYHVAAHEYGHAIYNLKHIGNVLTPSTVSVLEEPRADLAAATTIQLMHAQGQISSEKFGDIVINLIGTDLRRYKLFDNESTKAYTISAMNLYNAFERLGIISKNKDKLEVDCSKLGEGIDFLKDQFEEMLDFEDKVDAKKLESMLSQMDNKTDLVQFLVRTLSTKS